MSDIASVALIALAVVAVFLLGRALGLRHDAASSAAVAPSAPGLGSGKGALDGQTVAVIAAAVAAASGMAPGSFRVVGIEPSSRALSGPRGLNTPVWGHVERFNRGE